MDRDLRRRVFLGMTGAAVAGGLSTGAYAQAGAESPPSGKAIKIVGISCSPRKGKTTAAAVRAALDAAKEAAPDAEVELIELAGMKIPAELVTGEPLDPGERDDFPTLVPKLADPKVAGIILGSPVYFANMTALCKAFLDRCIAFRAMKFALSNKVAGALAVGGARNGGQELTVQSIQAALLCQEMIVVGDGRPTGRIGATLWSREDDVSGDEFGLQTARNLGRRVAEVALRVWATGD